MTEVIVWRRGLTLTPYDGLSELEIERFPMGRALTCTLKKHRSNPNLRHYFACLHAFSEATGRAPARVLHELLKMECGLVTAVSTQSGGIKLVPDSVAFDKLSEADFIDYKRRAFDALRINFGVDPTTLSREGAELLGRDTIPEAPSGLGDGCATAADGSGLAVAHNGGKR